MERPIHPAELMKEFIGKNKFLSEKEAADLLNCNRKTIRKLLNFSEDNENNRGISQEMGWKMSQLFDNPKEFWNNLQKSYDLWEEIKKEEVEPVMKFNDDDIEFIKLVAKLRTKNEGAPHPGDILKSLIGNSEQKYSITEAGLIMGIPRQTLSDLLQADQYKNDNVSLSPKMAIKLGKAFETSPEFWMNIQTRYDESLTQNKVKIDKSLAEYVKNIEANVLEMKDKDKDTELSHFLKKKNKKQGKVKP